MKFRKEFDSIGSIKVPNDKYQLKKLPNPYTINTSYNSNDNAAVPYNSVYDSQYIFSVFINNVCKTTLISLSTKM